MAASTSHITSKKLIPQLRFKEFNGGWSIEKLGDLAKIERGKFTPRPRNNPIYYNGEIPFVQTGDVVSSNGNIQFFSQTLNKKGLAVSKLFSKETILITIAANIGYTGVLKIDMACPDSLIGITPKENVDNYFLNYYLSTQQKKMDYLAPEGAQKNINIDFLKPYDAPTTVLPEQQKIAAFLSSVDDKIQLLITKKDLFTQYKKGIIQKLFNQGIRFKDEKGKYYPNWIPRKMGEVLFEHKLNSSGNEEVFSVSVHKGLINQVEHLGRVFAAKNTYNYNLVQPNDVVYTKSPTGNFPLGIIKQSIIDHDVIVSPLYAVFRPETTGLGCLLNAHFESPINVQNYLASIIQKGAKNTINITNYSFLSKKLKLPISKEEQQKIGNYLSAIDTKIESVNQQLENTKSFKKGLLQQMFVAA